MPRIPENLPLDDCDLAKLRESGLSDTTIRKNELRTDGDALAFVYCGVDGIHNCHTRKRPHTPRLDKDGKPIKYEQPAGTPLKPYFPVGNLESWRQPGKAGFLTEGEIKALLLDQEGYPAIGLGGVYGWKKKGLEELIDGLKEIDWQGRVGYIAFDYDAKPATRHYVTRAKRRLAKLLREAGALEVYDVELPPGPDGEKQGVDDFIVANGIEAFAALVAAAKPVPAVDIVPLRTAEGRTDAANAARLIARFGDMLRWVGPWDKWLIWDGRRWKLDSELQVHALAKQIGKALWAELASDLNANQALDRETIAAMYSFAKTSNNANGIAAMVALARSEPGVAIGVSELDSHPWLLNVVNGTIDLRTGETREHRREDYITKLAPVTFDPAAKCPTFDKFIDTIFASNGELIGYLQRLHGYSLTGSTEEHILPIEHGTGSNGKSTKSEAMLKLLGPDYAMKAPPDLLMAKRGESHPTERADLHGKRYVVCIETEAGRRMAESLVKELTGGDRVRARRMREDFWEFVPTHHIWLASNHKPIVIGTDHGMWRRIKMIPFDVVIPDDQQDKKLPAKLEAELPGILNWAIAGCLDWQRNGMREPAIVQAATKKYSDEMDDIGQFLNQSCEFGEHFALPATMLFNAFTEATGSNISQKSFGAELAKRGFISSRITSGPNKAKHCWKGLRLIEQGFYDVGPDASPFAKHLANKAKGGA